MTDQERREFTIEWFKDELSRNGERIEEHKVIIKSHLRNVSRALNHMLEELETGSNTILQFNSSCGNATAALEDIIVLSERICAMAEKNSILSEALKALAN